ncbi:MAG: hypothetical protein H8E44_47210 [Planctomycetes bacterium]|nr:hypothetical protein [Planctomycetota bacterium]
MKRKFSRAIWLCCLCVLAAGCSESYEEPTFSQALTGKLLKGGQPLALDKTELGDYARIELSFVPVDGGSAWDAPVAEDGSFELELPEGESLSGKYKVVVFHYADGEEDALGGKFDEANSPVVVELPQENLTIDLDKPQG